MLSEQKIVDTLHAMQYTSSTQDPGDTVAGEYYIANTLRKYADKRYKIASEAIKKTLHMTVAEVQENAIKNQSKHAMTDRLPNFICNVSANAPATRTDTDALRTSLIKQGVKREIIDKAFADAVKQSAPATSVEVLPVE
jgi:hypothetical protein